ncbi:O-antigen ligase family protein [Flavobacterium microcysteis]
MKTGSIKIHKIYYTLFILGLFFFPFNNFKGLSLLGEFRNEAGAYFLLLGFLVMLFEIKILIPSKHIIFQTLLVLLLWCLVSTILNFDSVITNYFKFTSGINRFIRQYISLIISSLFFFLFFFNSIKNIKIDDLLIKIRKIFLYSLVVISIYGFFEIMVSIFYVSQFRIFLEVFSYLPFMNVNLHPEKIASVTFEPPFLAIYLITVASWMFSYIITEKGLLKFIPTLLILLLTYYSGSRTALIIITFQFFIFVLYLLRNEKHRKMILNFFKVAMVFFSFLLLFNSSKIIESIEEKVESLNFKENLKDNVSNQSRFGMQYAALVVFAENPIAGVGFGQQAYHSRLHYPKWATKNNYEFKLFYQNSREPSFPPAYNLYTRLLAEIGIIGIAILFFFFYFIIKTCIKCWKKTKNEKQSILLLVLFVSFIGFFINWMQFDSFRMYGFWLVLAILIKLSIHIEHEQNITTDTPL